MVLTDRDVIAMLSVSEPSLVKRTVPVAVPGTVPSAMEGLSARREGRVRVPLRRITRLTLQGSKTTTTLSTSGPSAVGVQTTAKFTAWPGVSVCPDTSDDVIDEPDTTLAMAAVPVPSNESDAEREDVDAAVHVENSPKSIEGGVVKAMPFF